MSIKSLVKQVLIEKENRRYHKLLSDKSVTYGQWVRAQEEACWGFGEVPENANEAGDFIVICASDGTLAKYAIKNIARYFNEHPRVQLLYGDEDVVGEAVSGGDTGSVRGRTGEVRGEGRCAPWHPPLLLTYKPSNQVGSNSSSSF